MYASVYMVVHVWSCLCLHTYLETRQGFHRSSTIKLTIYPVEAESSFLGCAVRQQAATILQSLLHSELGLHKYMQCLACCVGAGIQTPVFKLVQKVLLTLHPTFFCVFRGSNSGPHICTASTLQLNRSLFPVWGTMVCQRFLNSGRFLLQPVGRIFECHKLS